MRSLAGIAVVLGVLSLAGLPEAHAIDEAALRAYQQAFAREMCKDGGSWLKCFQLAPSDCTTVLGTIVERCTRSIVEQQKAPAKDENEVKAASDAIVQCVERDFREKHDAFKLNTEECRNL